MTREPVPPVVPHRGGTGSRGTAHAMARERVKCLACNGRGTLIHYRDGATLGAPRVKVTRPCDVCGGTKREPGR